MKKLLAVMMALALLLGCALALGEESYQIEPESMVYESKWVSEGFTAEIYQEEEGFRVLITRMDDYPNGTCWEYSALYNAESKKLLSMPTGVKSAITYTEDGTFEFGKSVYEDGEAEFSLTEEGTLVWKDLKEDAGKGVEFRKIGFFDGTVWVCDRAKIEMDWEEEGYKVYVEWGSNAWESRVWMYSCYYDPQTNSLSGFGTCEDLTYDDNGIVSSSEEVYDLGEVAFALTEDGRLQWFDAVEDAGKDMLFERMDY